MLIMDNLSIRLEKANNKIGCKHIHEDLTRHKMYSDS